jgi:hypothetical protein
MDNKDKPILREMHTAFDKLKPKKAQAAVGAYKFKKSGSANAAEKRNRTDAKGNSGFGASKPPTRAGYINLARPGSTPVWVPKDRPSYKEFKNAKNKTTLKGMGIIRRRGAK